MKHFFVVNPTSGSGKEHGELIRRINDVCNEKRVEYEVKLTEYPGHARELITKALDNASDTVRFYACGGDGTVNEVADGILGNPHAEFSVIPVGTGNDFVRSFSPEGSFKCVEDQIAGTAMTIDSVTTGSGSFVNMLNVGFDSAVVATIARLRNKFSVMRGKFAYIISVAINFLKMPKTTLECVFDDGERVSGKYLLAAFSNGQYYGGGFKAAPRASVDDGIMDVLLVRPCSRFVFLKLISKYKNGTLLDDRKNAKYIFSKKCKAVTASFSKQSWVCVDGEVVGEHSFEMKVLPGALKFSQPRKGNI